MPPPSTSSRFGMPSSSSAPVRVDHARVVVRDERQRHRLRAGGDDRLVEGHDLRRPVVRRRPRPGSSEVKRPMPGDDRHLALLGQPGQAAGQLLDDAVLPAAQLVDVDLRARRSGCRGGPCPASRRSPWPRAAAPSTGCSRRSGRRRRASASARPARPACRDRRRGRRRCSRRDRRRAPAPRRGGRRATALAACAPERWRGGGGGLRGGGRRALAAPGPQRQDGVALRRPCRRP